MAKKIEIENELFEENGETVALQQEQTEKNLLKLKESLKEKSEESADYLEHLQRLQAEFENYKKRTIDEKSKWKESGKEDILKQILPIVDNIEKAITHYNGNGNEELIIKGIELIYKQIQDMFKKEGVAKIDSVGKKFNPSLHEAIITEFSDSHSPGIILEELEPGYSFNGKLLRPTRAKVSKTKEH